MLGPAWVVVALAHHQSVSTNKTNLTEIQKPSTVPRCTKPVHWHILFKKKESAGCVVTHPTQEKGEARERECVCVCVCGPFAHRNVHKAPLTKLMV